MLTEEQAGTIKEPDEYKLIIALPGSGKTFTNDGTFHQISLNYFNGTGKWSDLIDGGAVGGMCRAIQLARPEVNYSKATNIRVEGLLERDYRD